MVISLLLVLFGGITSFAFRNRRKLEKHNELISESMGRHKATLDKVADGIITCNEGGLIETINQAALQLFGYLPQEIIGQSLTRLLPELQASVVTLPVISASNEPKDAAVTRHEVSGFRKGGASFLAEVAISHVYLVKHFLFTLVVRDITERKRIEAALIEKDINEKQRPAIALINCAARMCNLSCYSHHIHRIVLVRSAP